MNFHCNFRTSMFPCSKVKKAFKVLPKSIAAILASENGGAELLAHRKVFFFENIIICFICSRHANQSLLFSFPSLCKLWKRKLETKDMDRSFDVMVTLRLCFDCCFYVFRYGGGYDLASRRKNATRESTATLKQWLNEHKKNPYPTKGEKIMLAIITKMTLTQVSSTY